MLTLTVNLHDAQARDAVKNAAAALSPESAAAAAAEGAADAVRAHLTDLARTRHRPSQRLNFYLAAADAVTRRTAGPDAYVAIPHTGLAQRFHGGRIAPSGRPSPVTGRPVTRLAFGLKGTPAEGHVPADFPDLFPVSKKGVPRHDRSQKAFLARRQGDTLQRLFLLVDEVTQDPDPSVLPKDAALLDAAADAILDLYQARIDDAAATAP